MSFTVYRHVHAEYSWGTLCATRVDRVMPCDTITVPDETKAIDVGRTFVGRQSFGEITGKSFSVRDANGRLIHWS